MNKLLKNKSLLIAVAVILFVLFIGLYFVFKKPAQNAANQEVSAMPTQIPVPTIAAEVIGLSLKSGQAGKTVIATVENVSGITTIEGELSYTSKGDIPRGALGQFDLTKKPITKEFTLGTCSDVCHYDQDVSNIRLVLKITKEDGKIYQSQATLASVKQQ